MKNKIAIILSILLLGSIVFNLFLWDKNSGSEDRERQLKVEIRSLEDDNDSLLERNIKIQIVRADLESEIDSLNNVEVVKIDNDANNLLRRRNEAIRPIDDMQSNDLVELFAGIEFKTRQDTNRRE